MCSVLRTALWQCMQLDEIGQVELFEKVCVFASVIFVNVLFFLVTFNDISAY